MGNKTTSDLGEFGQWVEWTSCFPASKRVTGEAFRRMDDEKKGALNEIVVTSEIINQCSGPAYKSYQVTLKVENAIVKRENVGELRRVAKVAMYVPREDDIVKYDHGEDPEYERVQKSVLNTLGNEIAGQCPEALLHLDEEGRLHISSLDPVILAEKPAEEQAE